MTCTECGKPMFDGERGGYCDACKERHRLCVSPDLPEPFVLTEEGERLERDVPRGY